MRVTLYMAISANGIIATETGDEEFLSHENWEKFCELARAYGNFVVGRKTYEAVKKWDGGYNFDDLVGVEKVVISQNQSYPLDKRYILASSPQDAIAKLSRFEKALVTGGANINSAFAKANLLDEIIVNVEPVFVGKGIPMFAPENFEIKAELISADTAKSGIATLRYKILK
ncbi:MAG: dihydrofolate reductase [bacterium]|nr:dihydrofolate reductase [bacterium]MDZ4296600.1 dihydrofolate reductase [Patescibacteria group bacterium]